MLYDSYVTISIVFLKRTIVTYVTCHKYIKACMTKYLTHIYVKCITFVLFRIDFGYQDYTVNLYVDMTSKIMKFYGL